MAPAAWRTVRVRPSADDAREVVIAALFGAGSQGVHEDGDAIVTHFPSTSDTDRVRQAVLAVAPRAEVTVADTPDVDWSERWRDRIGAHALGRLTIAPPWLADPADAERTVVIDPGMAFGTGEHATTRGVVRLMQDVVRAGDVVADLGAGSAVLAIAAAKLGASRVVAIELDPDAIGNAEENVRANGVTGRVIVVEGDAELLLPLVAPVRVVLANIISSVLVALLPTIARALLPGGQAILSGILFEERAHMLDVLGAEGWRVEREDHEDIWWSASIARR